MKYNLNSHWAKDGDGIRWVGTKEQFDEWRKQWKEQIPKCPDFCCCHELMSCGINHICGECSIFLTASRGLQVYNICIDVDCADCLRNYKCKYGHQSREQNTKEKTLKFVVIPMCDTCRYKNEDGKRCSGIDKVRKNDETHCSAWRLWMEGDE